MSDIRESTKLLPVKLTDAMFAASGFQSRELCQTVWQQIIAAAPPTSGDSSVERLREARDPDWTIERDSEGEAMVCTGCGTTRTLEHIRYFSPAALSCCPERSMIPVRQALAIAALSPAVSSGVGEPVAWLYEKNGRRSLQDKRQPWNVDRGWAEIALYAAASPAYTPRPAATDQAGEVEQSDRDAAADILDSLSGYTMDAAHIRSGDMDHNEVVQRIARHRHAALTQEGAGSRPEVGEVVGIDPWEGAPASGPHEQRLRDQRTIAPNNSPAGGDGLTSAQSDALLCALKIVDAMAGEMNGVPPEPRSSPDADDVAGDLAAAFSVPLDQHWPEAVLAALNPKGAQ